MSYDRRNFLKSVAAGAGAGLLLPRSLGAEEGQSNLVVAELQKPDVNYSLDRAVFNLQTSGKSMMGTEELFFIDGINWRFWSDFPGKNMPYVCVEWYVHNETGDRRARIDVKNVEIDSELGGCPVRARVTPDDFLRFRQWQISEVAHYSPLAPIEGESTWYFPGNGTVQDDREKILALNALYQQTIHLIARRLMEVHDGISLEDSVLQHFEEARKKLVDLVEAEEKKE